MRNIYEFVETVLINKYWYLFNLNICSDDFSLGRARSILLEGLFVGLYDLKTLESRLDLLERQPYTVVYQTFLRNKLLKSASLIRFHQGGFRRTATQRLQELKHESFDFLDPTDRVKMEHDVLVTAFYGGSRGKTVAQRLQELKHESFDFLDPKDRVKMEEDAVNTALILSATRREGLHIGAQSTSVSSDTVAASIVKKFKSTHSVVVNTELEVMEAQFVALTNIIPQLAVLEDHAVRNAHKAQLRRESRARSKNGDVSRRKIDKAALRDSTTSTPTTPWHEFSEAEARKFTHSFVVWFLELGAPTIRKRLKYCLTQSPAHAHAGIKSFQTAMDGYDTRSSARCRAQSSAKASEKAVQHQPSVHGWFAGASSAASSTEPS